MSRSCPVITTVFAGGAEVVQKEEAGIVVRSADPDSLSKAIAYIAENKDLAKRWGKIGREAVKEKYTWDALSKRFVEIYEECASNDGLGVT
jgi:glycosyltransferase involved in cell wall biosynthesis